MLKIVTINNSKEVERRVHYIVDKGFMNYEFYYEYHNFYHDEKNLDAYLQEKHSQSFYIIEDSNKESLEIINKIKNKYKQINAFVFIITHNKDLQQEIEKKYPFNTKAVIDILQDNTILEDCVNYLAAVHEEKENVLPIKYEGIIRRIPYEEILYIEKIPNSKNCVVVSITESFNINKPLSEIKSRLNSDFIQSHRSAIINKNNVKRINLKEKKIIFFNGVTCNLLSRNHKKDLKKLILK